MNTRENYKMVIERVFKTMKEIDLEDCPARKSRARKTLRELNKLSQKIDEENLNNQDKYLLKKIKKKEANNVRPKANSES